jgi:hypothetical protein
MNSTLRAFGQRSACADRKILSASAKADAWRASASEGRFQSAQSLRPAVGFTRRMNSTLRAFGQRSACADRKILSASAKADARRASASEGRFQSAQSLRPAVGFTRRMNSTLRAFGRRSACADREMTFASAKADAWRASA